MINIYKSGGKFKRKDGTKYSVKTINQSDKPKFTTKGWVTSLDSIEVIEDAVFEEVVEKPARAKRKTTEGS